jgi:hypothetical protein
LAQVSVAVAHVGAEGHVGVARRCSPVEAPGDPETPDDEPPALPPDPPDTVVAQPPKVTVAHAPPVVIGMMP